MELNPLSQVISQPLSQQQVELVGSQEALLSLVRHPLQVHKNHLCQQRRMMMMAGT